MGSIQIAMLNELSQHIYQGNAERGFWDEEVRIGERLMLVNSELCEALEADRRGDWAEADDDLKHDLSNLPRITNADKEIYANSFKGTIKDTVEDEIADAIIRLLDLCGGLNIDIDFHLEAKLAYNATRERLHGKRY